MRRLHATWTAAGTLLSVMAAGLSPQAAISLPRDFDAHVARTMKQFEVPGLAIAVVKDGKGVLAKGYGVRPLGDSAPVGERTLFRLASNTKALPATALR